MGYLGTKPANSPLTSELIPDGMIGTSDLANGAVTTDKITDLAVTPAKLSQKITLDTAKTATSTSVDFTGIPSWVKRITVMFSGVSTNGTSFFLMQLGTSSGFEVSGYLGACGYAGSGTATTLITNGFGMYNDTAADLRNGAFTLNLLNSNTWTCSGLMAWSTRAFMLPTAGSKSLSGTLDRIRITTVNGTDAFDAGQINIMYEG